MVVGYPPCPHIRQFKTFIETQYGLPVIVGSHPIPLKYWQSHERLPFWAQANMAEIAGQLVAEPRDAMELYDQ